MQIMPKTERLLVQKHIRITVLIKLTRTFKAIQTVLSVKKCSGQVMTSDLHKGEKIMCDNFLTKYPT